MPLLNQHIASEANREDKCTGHFLEDRIKKPSVGRVITGGQRYVLSSVYELVLRHENSPPIIKLGGLHICILCLALTFKANVQSTSPKNRHL
ncbi:hypothetical protein A1OW_19475 [Enterovibrio norvegicus]|nr:hypothetical protein A1OW_19475 [Enterovibrio norvegicus]